MLRDIYGSLGLDSDAYTTFQNDCVWFEGLITRFHASLAPSDGSLVKSSFLPSSPGHSFVHPSSSNPVLTHLLVSCAYMQVQKILASCGVADALQRCISTARCIINTLSEMNQLGSPHLHPISGTLCAMACSVFGDELAGMEVLGDWDLNDLGIINTSSQVDRDVLLQGLEAGMATMSVLQMDSPLMSKSSTFHIIELS